MASLSGCPVEIIKIVLEFIPKINDLLNLALTSRLLHDIAISELYKKDDRNSRRGLMWGAMFGSIKVVQLFMDNGADPNWYWRTDRKGPWSGDFYISPVPGRLALGEYTTSDDCGRVSQYDRYGRHLPAHYRSRDFPYLPIGAQFPDVSRGSRYWSPLHLAVREGHMDIVRLLLRHGADANRSCRGVCACSIPRRLATRTDPSFQGFRRFTGYRKRWSALHIAICSGHDEVAFALLHAGVSICVDSNGRGITALHDACRHGRLAVAQFIIENSFQTNLDVSNNLGETPLDYAFMHEQWGCLEYLVTKGANLTGLYRMLVDAITHGEYATVHRVLYCIVERLASSEARLESINPVLTDNIPLAHILFNPLPIHDRCEIGGSQAEMSLRLDCLRSLLEVGEDVDGRDPRHKNQTLLMAAVLEGFTEGMRLLLDFRASVDYTNDDGDTALVLACRTGQSADNVEMLLDYGARPTVQNLERVLRYNDISAARLLHSKLDTSSLGPKDILGLFRAVWTSDGSCLELVLDIDQEDTIIKDKLSLVRLREAHRAITGLKRRVASCSGPFPEGFPPACAEKIVKVDVNPEESHPFQQGKRHFEALFRIAQIKPKGKRQAHIKLLLEDGVDANLDLVQTVSD